MTSRCCLPYGYSSESHRLLLDHLAAAGIEIPEGARVWGPGGGWAWRLVDKVGADLGIRSRVPLRTVTSGTVELVEAGGEIRVREVA